MWYAWWMHCMNTKFWVENTRGTDISSYLSTVCKIILKWMFEKWMVTVFWDVMSCISILSHFVSTQTAQCNIMTDNRLCNYCHEEIRLHRVWNGLNWLYIGSFVKHRDEISDSLTAGDFVTRLMITSCSWNDFAIGMAN